MAKYGRQADMRALAAAGIRTVGDLSGSRWSDWRLPGVGPTLRLHLLRVLVASKLTTTDGEPSQIRIANRCVSVLDLGALAPKSFDSLQRVGLLFGRTGAQAFTSDDVFRLLPRAVALDVVFAGRSALKPRPARIRPAVREALARKTPSQMPTTIQSLAPLRSAYAQAIGPQAGLAELYADAIRGQLYLRGMRVFDSRSTRDEHGYLRSSAGAYREVGIDLFKLRVGSDDATLLVVGHAEELCEKLGVSFAAVVEYFEPFPWHHEFGNGDRSVPFGDGEERALEILEWLAHPSADQLGVPDRPGLPPLDRPNLETGQVSL
jgi:hypothetical protein